MSLLEVGSEIRGRVKVKYGMPYSGYVSSTSAINTPRDKVWGDTNYNTKNYLFDPIEGYFYSRLGSTPIGGANGILEAGMVLSRSRAMTAILSPSIADLGDGYETHCVLYTRESATAANNNSALYVRSTIGGGTNYTLGMEFSANHYPGAAAATANIKCPPYFRTLDGVWGRLNTATTRQYALSGSRGMLQAGQHLYFPCLNSMPLRWNKRWNDSSASGSQNLRLYPMGRIPPLGRLSVATGTANATGTWRSGDKFYLSVVPKYRDGTIGPPMIPRNVNDQLTSGFGLFTLGASCDYITVSGLPICEDDCEGRFVCRSTKKWGDGTNPTEPDPQDLRLAVYIPNNTDTSVILYDGNDLGLAIRNDVIPPKEVGGLASRQWPSPARYIWPFDGRFGMGYTKPHPGAIILAPDVNVADDSVSILTTVYEFALSAGVLTLYKGANTTAITADSTRTVQQVVDTINATTDSGGNGGKWHAALVPGADGSVACGSAAANNDNLASTTGIDVGDTAARVRCFASSYPGIMYYSTSYLNDPARSGPHKTRWRFSEGGPELGGRTFVDMWPAGNIRTGPDSWGILMGGAPLANGCLIFFSKAIILFRNSLSESALRGSGLDRDYHPADLFTNLGCLSEDSIAYGDGWAGCLTDRGYMIFDGTPGGIANISTDLFNPATQIGEWSYEIGRCRLSVGADLATPNSDFHAKVIGSQLHITYRTGDTASGKGPNKRIVYDFSASRASTGLSQMLRPDGSPWGWSTPLFLFDPTVSNACILTEVATSSGVVLYATVDTNTGATDGRVDQLEVGTSDNGTNFLRSLYGPQDTAGTLKRKQLQELSALYLLNDTMTLAMALGAGGAQSSVSIGTLPSTGASGVFGRQRISPPSAARAPVISHQYSFGQTTTGRSYIWGLEADFLVTEAYE